MIEIKNEIGSYHRKSALNQTVSIKLNYIEKNKLYLDKKNRSRKTGKLTQISALTIWREFKRHTIDIKDELLRARLSKLVEAVSAPSDQFVADLMYHFLCWQDHISNCISPKRDLF